MTPRPPMDHFVRERSFNIVMSLFTPGEVFMNIRYRTGLIAAAVMMAGALLASCGNKESAAL